MLINSVFVDCCCWVLLLFCVFFSTITEADNFTLVSISVYDTDTECSLPARRTTFVGGTNQCINRNGGSMRVDCVLKTATVFSAKGCSGAAATFTLGNYTFGNNSVCLPLDSPLPMSAGWLSGSNPFIGPLRAASITCSNEDLSDFLKIKRRAGTCNSPGDITGIHLLKIGVCTSNLLGDLKETFQPFSWRATTSGLNGQLVTFRRWGTANQADIDCDANQNNPSFSITFNISTIAFPFGQCRNTAGASEGADANQATPEAVQISTPLASDGELGGNASIIQISWICMIILTGNALSLL